VRLLIRVLNPHFHDISVNGRRILVSFHFFMKMQPSQRPGPSITDYTLNIFRKHAIHAIFLNGAMMIPEKAFVCGIYHTIKDMDNNNIHASPVFALNVLMHAYCTSQVNMLKEKVIPGSFHDALDDESPIVMILVSFNGVKENHDEILDEVQRDFLIEPSDVQDEKIEVDADKISNVIDSIYARNSQVGMIASKLSDNEWINKLLYSKMALYSLSLQLKC